MKRRVEITEPTGVKLGRLALECGDVVSLDSDIAKLVIDAGWGKCAATGEQGERKAGTSVSLSPADVLVKIGTL